MTRQRLKDLATLGRARGRRAHGVFLVEGLRSVEAAVQAQAPLVEILIVDDLDADRVEALAAAARVPVWRVPGRDLDRIGDAQSSQGVVAVARSVVRRAWTPAEGPLMLLDGVQDPGNVGALVRTAAWFGVQAVVADDKTADFESPKAVRASMGGVWDLGLVRVPSLLPVLPSIRAAGLEIWGADLGGVPVRDWAPSRPSALILGSEAHGLSAEVAGWLDRGEGAGAVHIPRAATTATAGTESLNVAVAGGVLLSRWLG